MKSIARLLCLLAVWLLALPIAGQEAGRPRVGLVLGGGGAKGAAEVGALRVIEEAGVPIDYIAGTSIGAILGGLYAIGHTTDELEALFRTQDWTFLLSDQVRREASTFQQREASEVFVVQLPLTREKKVTLPSGYQSGQNLMTLFKQLTVGYHEARSFDSLPTPFRCVAVDLVTGRERVLASGSLPEAMRASMSIPGVFTPVDSGQSIMVDGGALNNFPVDVVREMGADVVIGVDLSQGLLEREDLGTMGGVVRQLINIMGRTKYEQNRADVDVYINPDLRGFYSMSFQPQAIDSMLRQGEAAARAKWDELLALRRRVLGPDAAAPTPRPATEPAADERYFVSRVVFEGIDEKSERLARKRLKLADSTRLSSADIARTVERLRGLNIFDKVEYRMMGSGPYELHYLLSANATWQLGVGARFDTRDIASVLVHASSGQRLSASHHFAATARIARGAYLQLDYSYGNLLGNKIALSYQLRHNDFDLYSNRRKVEALTFLSHRLSAAYTVSLYNFSMRLGARLEHFDYHHSLYSVDYEPQRRSSDLFLNYFIDFTMDTFDRKYYPTRGARAVIGGTLFTDNGVGYDGSRPFVDASFSVATACRLTDRLYLLPSAAGRFVFGDNIASIYQNYVGGNFPGSYLQQQLAWESAHHVHIVDHNFVGLRLGARYRVRQRLYFTATGEYAKEAHRFERLLSGADVWGAALRASYDFALGPIGLQVHYSNLYRHVGIYASAGFWF